MAKLHIRGTGNSGKEDDGRTQQNGSSDNWSLRNQPNSKSDSKQPTSCDCVVDTDCKGETHHRKINISLAAKPHARGHEVPNSIEDGSVLACSRECKECLIKLESDVDSKEAEPEVTNLNAVQREDGKQFPSLGASTDSNGSSSSKGYNESNTIVDCEIHWEDLHLGEEVGQGKLVNIYIYIYIAKK